MASSNFFQFYMYMKIAPIAIPNKNKTSFNNIAFCARNPEIRFADDIARKINNAIPRISPSNIEDFKHVREFREFMDRIIWKLFDTRVFQDVAFDISENNIEKMLACVEPIKEAKIGNCGESAILAGVATKLNGIKKCEIRRLETTGGKNLDHSVLYINSKKPYIIDAWLGFADYVPNAFKKYTGEYRYHFDIQDTFLDKPIFKKVSKDGKFSSFIEEKISPEDIKVLKRLLPELVIKK